MRIEETILKHLLHEDAFARKALPFLQEEYFQEPTERLIFRQVYKFMEKYNNLPTKEALKIEVDNLNGIPEEIHKNTLLAIDKLDVPDKVEEQWLVDSTEKFCQERAIYNAIKDSIVILDGKDKNRSKGSIPEILSKALAVSFDSHIGHDFLDDFEMRFDFYHTVEEKVKFDIDLFNKITRGGVPRKSLNIFLAGTGVGKTLTMCHCAAGNLMDGKNVLYITMEMSEEKIAERIDANLLNIELDQLEVLPRDIYDKKIAAVTSKTTGKLIIKEFPTAGAHVGHFRHLLNELNLKRGFVPDIIYIDYINICLSARIKPGSNVNSYTYVKSIAEEFRGLAVEKNVPLISATQVNRSGFTNSDPGLEDTSESFGLPATADFMVALVSTDELEQLNQIMVKQLKNRYNDPTINKRFVVGIDKAKMRLYDLDDSAQKNLVNDSVKTTDRGPVMDKTKFGERANEEDSMQWMTKKAGRKNFDTLKT